jgi:hypothetical protein
MTTRSRAVGAWIGAALLASLAPRATEARAGIAPGAAVAAVSPGEIGREAEVSGACPTFSWTALAWATGYEISVFELGEEGGRGAELQPRLVLDRRFAAGASSWTPSRAECLGAGRSYAWTVRALAADATRSAAGDGEPEESSPWSAALRFRISGEPSAEEVAAALDVLRRWSASRAQPGGSVAAAGRAVDRVSGPPAGALRGEPAQPATERPEVGQGIAAIRGEVPDPSGATYGVVGTSHSPAGAGLVAINTTAGADLILDGEAGGATDTALTESSLDRASTGAESFDVRNSGGGTMTLRVDGVDVVTTATDRDTLGALACSPPQVPKRTGGVWGCAADQDTTYTAGNQLQLAGTEFEVVEGSGSGLDADTLDGLDSSAFAAGGHQHFGESWSGNAGVGLFLDNGQSDGVGVGGKGSSTSGVNTGVYGETQSTEGVGVTGYAPAPAGATKGVYGVSVSTTGSGVVGEATASTGANRGVLGTSPSSFGYGVEGLNQSASGPAYGVFGVTQSTEGTGVIGRQDTSTGAGRGVWGYTYSESGTGVRGSAVATAGVAYGVWGSSSSTQGVAVLGDSAATAGSTRGVVGVDASSTGIGVFGSSTATNGQPDAVYGAASSTGGVGVYGGAGAATGFTYGVIGYVNSSAGHGVTGWSTSSSSAVSDSSGVYGISASTQGSGVYGSSTAATGQAAGVHGISASTQGLGVFGESLTPSGPVRGVYGRVDSTQGVAVLGIAAATSGATYGVQGQALSTQGVGIYGFAPAPGAAGYFQGNVTVTGSLSKGGGSFKIDHPLDPEHKYLYHSFVESPDMMDIYNGNVTLDGSGSAWVELPGWFEALNRDFRYQLTPIGQPSSLWIAHRVADHRFEIRGGPGVEVSWQVTGIRHDRWAEVHRIPVEQVKPDDEQGTYLHPRAWGVPASRGLDARRREVAPQPEAGAPEAVARRSVPPLPAGASGSGTETGHDTP